MKLQEKVTVFVFLLLVFSLFLFPGSQSNLISSTMDWRAQDYSNSQGITAVQYDAGHAIHRAKELR